MKKNLLSVIILALAVMNLIFTSIMMFSVLGTSKKTSALVTDIATVLNLELADEEEEKETEIPMEDVENYTVPGSEDESMTVLLNGSGVEGDTENHYAMIRVVLYMNMKDPGYKKYRESLNKDVLMSLIVESVGQFSAREFKEDTEAVYAEILENIQKEFNSEFIFKVAFSDRKVQ